jgi:DNA-binding beta-propeller fold protein YncE
MSDGLALGRAASRNVTVDTVLQATSNNNNPNGSLTVSPIRRALRCSLVAVCCAASWTFAHAQGTAPRFTPETMANPVPTTIVTNALAAVKAGGVPLFQVDPFWPKPLPNNWILGQVSGVAVDRRDHVWIVQRPRTLSKREVGAQQSPPYGKCCYAAPPVLEFDASGNLLRAWGGPGAGYEWPENEHGIYVDDNDFVWIAGNGRNDAQILEFTRDGKFVMQIGRSGRSKGSNDTENLGSPADMFVDPAAKELYVADGYRNHRVIVFDSETGAYKRHWGAYGKPPTDEKLPAYDPAHAPAQQFGNPVHCVRMSREGLIYVCDRVNDRVQIFRKDGTFVSEHFFERATRLSGSVSDLVFSPDREQRFIYMVDGVNNEMRIIARAGMETLARVGRPGRYAGQFHVVHNIAVDRAGNVYTTEVNTGQRVQKFRRLDPQN